MTRVEDQCLRFGLMMDLTAAARAVGFSGVDPATWRWSMRAPIADLYPLRLTRWRGAGRPVPSIPLAETEAPAGAADTF